MWKVDSAWNPPPLWIKSIIFFKVKLPLARLISVELYSCDLSRSFSLCQSCASVLVLLFLITISWLLKTFFLIDMTTSMILWSETDLFMLLWLISLLGQFSQQWSIRELSVFVQNLVGFLMTCENPLEIIWFSRVVIRGAMFCPGVFHLIISILQSPMSMQSAPSPVGYTTFGEVWGILPTSWYILYLGCRNLNKQKLEFWEDYWIHERFYSLSL